MEAESAARSPTEASLCAGAVVLVQEEHAPSCLRMRRGVHAINRWYRCGRWWAELAVRRWRLGAVVRARLGCREIEKMNGHGVGQGLSAPLIALQFI